MAALDFPRLVYRGEPDVLGLGVGETARCASADDWADKQKAGWRLTREIPAAAPAKSGDKK